MVDHPSEGTALRVPLTAEAVKILDLMCEYRYASEPAGVALEWIERWARTGTEPPPFEPDEWTGAVTVVPSPAALARLALVGLASESGPAAVAAMVVGVHCRHEAVEKRSPGLAEGLPEYLPCWCGHGGAALRRT